MGAVVFTSKRGENWLPGRELPGIGVPGSFGTVCALGIYQPGMAVLSRLLTAGRECSQGTIYRGSQEWPPGFGGLNRARIGMIHFFTVSGPAWIAASKRAFFVPWQGGWQVTGRQPWMLSVSCWQGAPD